MVKKTEEAEEKLMGKIPYYFTIVGILIALFSIAAIIFAVWILFL